VTAVWKFRHQSTRQGFALHLLQETFLRDAATDAAFQRSCRSGNFELSRKNFFSDCTNFVGLTAPPRASKFTFTTPQKTSLKLPSRKQGFANKKISGKEGFPPPRVNA